MLPVEIADPGGWVGTFRLAVLAYVAVAAAWVLVRARAGREYLSRAADR